MKPGLKRLYLGLALGIPGIPAFAAQTPPPQPLVIRVTPGQQPHIPVLLKQATLDIRLALSFDSVLILNAGPAQRAGLKPFPLIGKRTFKSALIPGGEATFRGNLFGITPQGVQKSTLPVIWVDRPIAGDAEGVLALSVLKADRIILEMAPQAANSKVYTLTRKGKGDAGLKARVGDETIDVALELNSPDTVMNGRAAAALVAAGIIKRNGQVGFWKPFPGVALPFERLTPAPGATLLGLPLFKPGVRITEAQAQSLDAAAKAGTSTAEDDDDTITVTASRKKGRNPWILLGRDVLSHCSRIEFDRQGKTWHLTCAFFPFP